MGLRWCLWSDFSADSTGWFPTSVCVCELHRKGESQTGWCHLHCATALFKDTGKLTPFSLPSPCPKHDTVQSRWRPPPWPRGEVVSQALTETCFLLSEDAFTLGLLVKAYFGLFGWFWKQLSCITSEPHSSPLENGDLGNCWCGLQYCIQLSMNGVRLEWTSIDYIWLAY